MGRVIMTEFILGIIFGHFISSSKPGKRPGFYRGCIYCSSNKAPVCPYHMKPKLDSNEP